MNKPKKTVSTFDRITADPARKERFEKGYREFLLSEIVCDLMQEHHISVREMAKKTHLSPTVIQEIRSGKKKNATLHSITSILDSLGCSLVIREKKAEYVLNPGQRS